ncbi:MAG: TIGR00159 family protein [Phycisphaerales bacterium]|nr:TIGR00159 family protein [Phycisphaerales bacterium]
MLTSTLLAQTTRFPLLNMYIERLRGEEGFSWRALVDVFSLSALLELLLIGTAVYVVLRFLQGTRGARLMQAVLAIFVGMLVLWVVASVLQLDRILVLYPFFVGGTFLVALVVFQPELRRGLTRIGERFSRRARTAQSSRQIESLVSMATNLSRRKIGALVALERRVPVGGLLETGVMLDAEISRELLETIFWPGSTLHDLGVIISEGRIAAAGCEFPLAEADPAHRIIGSRHRAALGMSLETDALVVVVSEETGAISLAVRGKFHRDLDGDKLRELLAARLIGSTHDEAEAEAMQDMDAESDATSAPPNAGGPSSEPMDLTQPPDPLADGATGA